ncbi:glycoside hydrolase [Metarhizium robertsii]|uniref:Glycoside hydrolase n=1 Tax=Metarhizium robertsii TaxID=568076 RepID=A0A0A1UN39_9HYPO|nr:glycoside hydrolase [Metarhizium robertsii]
MNFTLYLVCIANLVQARRCVCPGEPNVQKPLTSTPPTVGKRGLAYNDARLVNTLRRPCRQCTWAYNWDWKDNGLSREVEFVPMLWNESTASQLQENMNVLRARGLKYILGFNEPDHADQADMTVARAVDSHMKYLSQDSDVAIGSPAVTSNEAGSTRDNPKSLDWLRGFLELCGQRGCKVDFCVVHWYGSTTQADAMISFLHRAHDACPGKPLWLTEFSATGSSDEVEIFMMKVLPILDSLQFIQRYAWFMTAVGNLLQSPDTLSSYGEKYASL